MPQENNDYWIKRLVKAQDKLYDLTQEKATNELKRVYRVALKDVQVDISNLYDKLVAESATGEITANDLYRYARYYEMQRNIQKRLQALGEQELAIDNKTLTNMYEKIRTLTDKTLESNGISQSTFSIIPEDRVKSVVDAVWCSDGKNFSSRLWLHKSELQNRINKGFIDCVSRGVPKDEIIKQLMNDFSVGFNQADRIVRTELTYVQGQACADSYKNAGITKYRYLSAHDGRVSDICKKLDKQEFNFSEMQVGVNYPPTHVRCRSTVTPILDL